MVLNSGLLKIKMKKYLKDLPIVHIIVIALAVISFWVHRDSSHDLPSSSVSNSNVVGTYVMNPDSSKRTFINFKIWRYHTFTKVKSISSSEKELISTSVPLLHTLTKVKATSVNEVKANSLYGNRYYVTNIDYKNQEEGAVFTTVDLSYVNSKTADILGLKPTKTVTLRYKVVDIKKDSKVSIKDDKLVITKDSKTKLQSYGVSKDTVFKFNYGYAGSILSWFVTLSQIVLPVAYVLLAFQYYNAEAELKIKRYRGLKG